MSALMFLNVCAGLEGTTLYSRIATDIPKTDPFTGLYLGTFGPHGPEVLQLQRSVTEVRALSLPLKLKQHLALLP